MEPHELWTQWLVAHSTSVDYRLFPFFGRSWRFFERLLTFLAILRLSVRESIKTLYNYYENGWNVGHCLVFSWLILARFCDISDRIFRLILLFVPARVFMFCDSVKHLSGFLQKCLRLEFEVFPWLNFLPRRIRMNSTSDLIGSISLGHRLFSSYWKSSKFLPFFGDSFNNICSKVSVSMNSLLHSIKLFDVHVDMQWNCWNSSALPLPQSNSSHSSSHLTFMENQSEMFCTLNAVLNFNLLSA